SSRFDSWLSFELNSKIMAKKKTLMPVQQAEIKRQYLQLDDKALASAVGSDPKTVCEFRLKNELTRNKYTKEKLSNKTQSNEGVTVDMKRGVKTSEDISNNGGKASD